MAVAEKLSMSLDEIIESSTASKPSRRSGRSGRRNDGATRMETDLAPRILGGVHKAVVRTDVFGRLSGKRSSVRTRSTSARSVKRPSDDDQLIEDGVKKGEFIKVSGESDVKKVAGKIAHDSRSGEPPALVATGPGSLNQAVKAIAIARSYLAEERLDVTCQPAFRDEKQYSSLALYLQKRKPVNFPKRNVAELVVGSSSVSKSIAGALAARVREDTAVCLTGIGVDAVSNCIRAISHARLYLEEDKCDIKALIEFVTIEKGGSSLSGVRFNMIVEDV